MPYSDPTNLAVVACPGGEFFADEVITHLRNIYKHRFTLKNETISRRYQIDKNDLIKKINFESDVNTSDISMRNATDKYRQPVQDVENHEPLALNDGKNIMSLSVNDHVMSMLVTVDAVRQAGAASVSLVVPAFPYSRQHKKKGRESLTASMLGHIYELLGVKRIITLDIHSREIINAFNTISLENLHASYQIIRELAKLLDLTGKTEDLVVVSPDTGAVDRNKFYASGLKLPLAMIYKERDYSIVTQDAHSTNIKSVKLLGDVRGKVAFLADDMLGTGGTLLKAMQFLKEQGATKVIAAISLPFFTGNAIELFDEAYKQGWFYRIIGTNAVYHEKLKNKEWYIDTNVSGLFANVITRVHHNQSLGDLLDNRNIIEKLVRLDTSVNEDDE